MPAYRDALAIDAEASAERLALAAQVLAGREGVVMLEGVVALRPTRALLLCEVIDPMPSARRCAAEYEVMVENAQRALEASKLRYLLPDLPRRWSVVEVHASGTTEVWRATMRC
jgi:hypothetical protein